MNFFRSNRNLAEVFDRLGRLAGDVAVMQSAPREPVPDWLADRLVYTAGIKREVVAALDLRQAVDLWTAYTAKPREV
jgi:mRNA interferase RelE/StbE